MNPLKLAQLLYKR